jgi:hypothetical protein
MICEKAKAENGIRGCTDEERSCNFTWNCKARSSR